MLVLAAGANGVIVGALGWPHIVAVLLICLVLAAAWTDDDKRVNGYARVIAANPFARWLGVGGAVALFVSAFLPWVNPTSDLVHVQKNTLLQSGYGWEFIVFAVAIALAVQAASRTNLRYCGTLLIPLGLYAGGYVADGISSDNLAISSSSGFGFSDLGTRPGTGHYVAAVGAGMVLVAGLAYLASRVVDIRPAGEAKRTRRAVTASASESSEPSMSSEPTHTAAPTVKICPECAEEVKAAARKCRFCGYRFDDAAPAQSRPAGTS